MDSTGLRIRLLGELELRLGERPLPPLGSARAASLLAYLLIHRAAPQPRQRARLPAVAGLERAAGADEPPPRAAHAAARAARRRPPARRHRRARCAGAPTRRRARRRGLRGRPGARRPCARPPPLYGGDLLAGAYDDWLHAERERLRGLLPRRAGPPRRPAGGRGREREAIAVAERLLRHDPLREEAYRLLMRLHAARGDRARALRAYHACAATLERELGVAPSAATRELYEALLPAPARRRAPAARAAGARRARGRVGAADALLARRRARAGAARARDGRAGHRQDAGSSTSCGRGARSAGAATAGARPTRPRASSPTGPWWRGCARRRSRARAAGWTRRPRRARAAAPRARATPPAAAGERAAPAAVRRGRAGAPARPPRRCCSSPTTCSGPTATRSSSCTTCARRSRGAPARRRHRAPRGARPAAPADELVTGLARARALSRSSRSSRLSRAETAALAERLAGARSPPATPSGCSPRPRATRCSWSRRCGPAGRRGAPLSPRVHAVIAGAPRAALRAGRASSPGSPPRSGARSPRICSARASGLDERRARARPRRAVAAPHRPRGGRRRLRLQHGRIREVAYDGLGPGAAPAPTTGASRTRSSGPRRRPLAPWRRRSRSTTTARARAAAAVALVRARRRGGPAHAGQPRGGAPARARARPRRALPAGAERDALELALLGASLAPLATVHGYGSAPLAAAQRRALELAPEPEPRSCARRPCRASRWGTSRTPAGPASSCGRAASARPTTCWRPRRTTCSASPRSGRRASRPRGRTSRRPWTRFRPAQRAAHLAGYGLDPEVICLSRLANTLWFLGRADAAREARDRALALAARVGHATSTGVAHVFGALLALELRDADGVRRGVAALGPAPREPGRRRPRATLSRGYVAVLDGRPGAGVARHPAGARRPRAPTRPPGCTRALVRVLLEACVATGDARAGLAATELPPAPGGRLWEAEGRRLRARFLAAIGAPDAAVEAELERALAVAREQGAPLLELRAATALLRRRGDDAPRGRASPRWPRAAPRGSRPRRRRCSADGGTLAERPSGDLPAMTTTTHPMTRSAGRRTPCAPASAAPCCVPARRATTRPGASGTARSTAGRR